MAWLKRNLFFVLSLAAGLALTGYCAWRLMGDLSNNTGVKTEVQGTEAQLEALKNRKPYPSQANIKNVSNDVEEVRALLADVKRTYAPFPPPPKMDEHGFSIYLEDTIYELRNKASNNEVELPENMNFGFTDQRDKLKFPLECIPLWMEQLTEIKALCDILYDAKINSLATFRRVPVSPSDEFRTPTDQLAAGMSNNAMATITPYKIEFRCFSAELTAVLNGLARSSHCIYPKNIVVVAADSGSLARRPVVTAAASAADDTTGTNSAPADTGRRGRRGGPLAPAAGASPDAGAPDQPKTRRPGAADAGNAGAVSPGRAPVTMLREHLLFVTLSVDVVNFK
jgi:hypothetical protein